ncbi:unnamed protein product [Vitrella brassicaformis CCMP3155]|uniref:EamA domain-containing protein n=1 Tax=Vitrella brassicaformis (strain CCMP3155) TaxID=1169540 RepID=A0A0G4EYN0_VITBC|nr:unnamed protein product [Vitrella brassicaformis CCMP3155]|eukprot:CEM04266.1 unnamed protein product [Vitrella brassicaformis CCMP3155]
MTSRSHRDDPSTDAEISAPTSNAVVDVPKDGQEQHEDMRRSLIHEDALNGGDAADSEVDEGEGQGEGGVVVRRLGQTTVVFLLAFVVIITGAFNYVTGKIRAKPLGAYDYFVSLFNSMAYCGLYWAILLVRIVSGQVTPKQLSYVWRSEVPSRPSSFAGGAWKWFVLTGLFDSCGNILGFISQPYVSGAVYSLMNQTIVPFTAIVSMIMLGRKYTLWQVCAITVVVCGAILALVPDLSAHPTGGSSHHMHASESLGFALLTALSTLPSALSFALKEKIFRKYAHHHHGGDGTPPESLDLFVVNSHGSLFGLLWVPLALPLNIVFGQTNGQPLSQYVVDGFSCFGGVTPDSCLCYERNCQAWGCCKYAFSTYMVYVTVGSALLAFICLKAVLPLSILLFAVYPWPLLDQSDTRVTPYTWVSLVIILGGVVWYKMTDIHKEAIKKKKFEGHEPPCLWPLPLFKRSPGVRQPSRLPSSARNDTH